MQSVDMPRGAVAALLGIVLVLLPGVLQAEQPPSPFPYPPALRPQVEFWKRVFTSSKQMVLLHDSVHMLIYKKLDLRPLYKQYAGRPNTLAHLRKKRIKRELKTIRASLRKLHRSAKSARLTAEEQRILRLFSTVSGPNKFRQAAAEGRVRAQTGIGEKFHRGIEISGRYMDEMEAIFRRAGLPAELTRLPLVESTFNIRAYSRVGAAGVWQFMPSTGRQFMRINRLIDERRDPIISARAAAKLLRANYERLGTWPLAITAYNHGRAGMARAVRQVGSTDIVRIIRSYKSRTFGFASRNFYAEFLAAVEVEKNAADYFGKLRREAPFRYDEVALDRYLSLGVAARCAGISPERLIDFNPALGRAIHQDRRSIPSGYRLRIPAGTAARFRRQYAALETNTHTVRHGQNLAIIAQRHGTNVRTLQQLNNIQNANFIRVGQRLLLPQPNGTTALTQAPVTTAPTSQDQATSARSHRLISSRGGRDDATLRSESTHTVQRGQTLGAIAQRYRTSVATLKALNGIKRANTIYPGQHLRLPGGYTTHKVQRGQTLGAIAQRYGTTVTALKRLNRIQNPSLLRIGQSLRVPLSY